jgi:hypothetical protein
MIRLLCKTSTRIPHLEKSSRIQKRTNERDNLFEEEKENNNNNNNKSHLCSSVKCGTHSGIDDEINPAMTISKLLILKTKTKQQNQLFDEPCQIRKPSIRLERAKRANKETKERFLGQEWKVLPCWTIPDVPPLPQCLHDAKPENNRNQQKENNTKLPLKDVNQQQHKYFTEQRKENNKHHQTQTNFQSFRIANSHSFQPQQKREENTTKGK